MREREKSASDVTGPDTLEANFEPVVELLHLRLEQTPRVVASVGVVVTGDERTHRLAFLGGIVVRVETADHQIFYLHEHEQQSHTRA